MRDRVDRLGVSEPEIRTQGNNQITIQLPGVKDPEAAAKIIGKTAQLELYDLETSLVPPSIDINGNPDRRSSVYDLLAGQQAIVKDNVRPVVGLRQEEEARRRAGLDQGEGAVEVRRRSCRPATSCSARPTGTVVISCGVQAVVCPGVGDAHRATRTTSSSTTRRTSRR